IDRFGLLPEATETLFAATELKLAAAPLGISKIEAGADVGRLHFASDNRIDPLQLIALVQSDSKAYRLEGDARLIFWTDMPDTDARTEAVEMLLDMLSSQPDNSGGQTLVHANASSA